MITDPIGPTIDRLKTMERAPGQPWFGKVGGLVDLSIAARANRLTVVDFAAWVAPAGGSAAQSGGRYDAGVTAQDVIDTIEVALTIKATAGNAGESAALEKLPPLRLAVIRELAGWRPTPEHEHFVYVRDRQSGIGEGLLIWSIVFRTQWTLETFRRTA